ncbi:uncharacterized protein LOC112539476 [Tetranychus urticae]|uniref:Gustatory receptor n=1 Tax=Tetranychus urticae TaxID=32264 RepID=T1KWS5_TETUR|nr:uncharacterized protein LOC112539476 [Tetranychus urticae]
MALNVLSKQKNYVLEKLSSFPFTVPNSNEFDLTVCKLVQRTERLTAFFQLDFNGPSQSNSSAVNAFGYRRYKWMDWFITINCLITYTKFVALGFSTSDSVAFYLGDSLFRAKDGQAIYIYGSIMISMLFVFREWILNLNAKGSFEILSAWKVCFNGFDSTNLQMNNLVAKRFRFTIFLFSIFTQNVLLSMPFCSALIYIIPCLSNPWIYKVPKLAFFCSVWSFPIIFVFTLLFSTAFGFFWYIVCSICFHLFRLYDLLHSADDLNHRLVDGKQLRSFCVSIIHQLNNFEVVSHKFRYLLLCYLLIFAAVGDFDIFLGTIVKVYNESVANLFAFLGFSILLSLGTFGLIFGNFISKLNRLTVKLHQLSTKNRLTMRTANMVLEIMDRAAGPYNGIKIGDLLTLEKSFGITFILENISALMLFICNIGPLIHTANLSNQN